ncbi:MAG: transglutaminase family protein [Spirochaetia bacterium]|nr:transglutaminase family protein [Spirochaetia bacterium]
MAIRVSLHHRTSYTYERPISIFPQIVRLRPAVHTRTPILSYSLKVTPSDHFINWQQDPFGNHLARLVFAEKTDRLTFDVDLVAELHSVNPFDFFLEPSAEQYPFVYEPQLKTQLAPYLTIQENGPLLRYYVEKSRGKLKTIDFLVELNQRLQNDVAYLIRMEPGVQTCEKTLTNKSGSCRDSAYLLVQVLRHLGLAARFVSGYLIQLVPDEVPISGPPGPKTDFTDLHAWAEVYLPGAGWIGLDATSGLFTGEGHIPLACTPEPVDAAPLSGAVEPCESKFDFEMRIERIEETPRVTKPYTEEQWREIYILGQVVDFSLEKHSVRLTMGAEPTFVSDKNRDAVEWNLAANGIEKKEKARELAHALRNRFATGASFHSGQGKWYPGEEIPRWSYSMFFRLDGEPVWQDSALLADETHDYGFDSSHASKFIQSLAFKLIGSTDTILAAYEDVYYYLWKEGNLPIDLDPMHKDLGSTSERNRLRILLERGLSSVTGFVLPLIMDDSINDWLSRKWNLKRERLYLIPGDSAMGYRLPLDSLEGKDPGDSEFSPMASRPPWPNIRRKIEQRIQSFRDSGVPVQRIVEQEGRDDSYGMRTALCVEPRNGRLHVFLPPQAEAVSYLELIACIETTAAELEMPVVIEGYEPPFDARLNKIAVTPDPGVIEVNVHPSKTWKDLCLKTTALYEEALKCGLTAEKFMLDGRRSGTGGGNHVTLGGETPMDSPFLRRPDLLRSFITYFQHHPALSYLFSGQFVGPTSQAPRVDETNPEAIYELGIALDQLPLYAVPDDPPTEKDSAWLLDRLLRHLLVDLTGNTHRTEICIDKLHSPDSLMGRLGLVEFRAFEMPYHPRMNALQALLLRAMVAHFWQRPYEKPLIQWGYMLRDKFRLPVYLWQDLQLILRDLEGSGFHFQAEWFLPFLDSRLPVYGTVQVGETSIELRMAIEAWNVLGEEMSVAGTARAVDSAVERVQVLVRHFHPERYALLCNGRSVPLQATETTGVYVAGVRFKAWDPPGTLHPSLPIHSPLYFDLFDKLTGHSIGGCTYHVFHPGGRSYDTAPVNEREAESRMLSRFFAGANYPGPVTLFDERHEFPCTLDLRTSPKTAERVA